MEFMQYLDYLTANGFGFAVELLSIIFGLVIMIVQVKKYFLYKKQANNEKELVDMKYRKEDYQSCKNFTIPSQSFNKVVPIYELDERSNSLVVVGTKDLQELINSCADCALDKILEKYGVLPEIQVPNCPHSDVVFDATDIRDDLCILADFAEDIENMRIRYNMPMASYDELQKHIAKLQLENDKHIQEQLSKQVKEINKDEI